jgi:hypothetical protein
MNKNKKNSPTPELGHAAFTDETVAIADLSFDPRICPEPSAKRIKQLIAGMKAGTAKHKTTDAVVLAIVVDGRTIVVANGAQMLAREKLKQTHVRVRKYELTIDQAIEMRRFDSVNRGPVDQLDRAKFVSEYVGWESGIKKAKAFLGLEKSQAHALRRLSEAEPAVLSAIGSSELSTSHGLKLMELKSSHPDLDVQSWVKRTIKEKLSVRAMRIAIKAQYGEVTERPAIVKLEATPDGGEMDDPVQTLAWLEEQCERLGDVTIFARGRSVKLLEFATEYPMEVGYVLMMLKPSHGELAEAVESVEEADSDPERDNEVEVPKKAA